MRVFLVFKGQLSHCIIITKIKMKRTRSEITLWEAANVHKHTTMLRWWKDIHRLDFQCDGPSTTVSDLETTVPKKMKIDTNTPFMTTFSVGIKPTKLQKAKLNEMLKVSNRAYNYCNWLVNHKDFKPKHFDLIKVVAKTNATDITEDLRMDNNDWYFDNRMTTIKNTSCKNYATMYKATQTSQKKKKVILRDKDIQFLREGSFQVPKLYVRFLKEKDTDNVNIRSRSIAIMTTNFGSKKNIKEKFLKLSKPVTKLPPINHDVRIKKRVNGKFVLQIPCDPTYTRKQIEITQDAMCGIDPGGRSFNTIFDPSNVKCYQVGIENDKAQIKLYQTEIDKAQFYLQKAIKKKHRQAKQDRITHLKRLHLKLKTFVHHIHLMLSSELVANYKHIALGKIPVSQIVKKDRLNHLSKKSNRELLCWSHYQFRQRLLNRAAGTDCNVIIQNESYTSQTCGRCGYRNKNLGSSLTYECPKCNYETHRDVNGARNILLKSLDLFTFQN